MELHLKIIGLLLICLALIHVEFPKYFNWEVELSKLSLINRQMTYIHTLFLALVLLLMGILCLTSSRDLATTPLGKRLMLGFGLFWFLRLIVQFFGYSSTLWRGKKFETIVHILFVFLWTYLSFVFLFIYWANNGI